jgi:hypothetical protein
MSSLTSLHRIVMVVALAACGSSSSSMPDAGDTPAQACESVGTSFCAKMYACYSATDIMGFGLPATEAECVTQENAHCGDATPAPGYCKGKTQVSAQAALACSAEFDGLSCTQLMQSTSSGACKTGLCSM